jgi:predicted ATP-grasp superfamily ATP-dependent carboligase
VIFDVFGNVIKRDPDKLESIYRTSAAAKKAMYEYLNTIDAYKVTAAAISKQAEQYRREIEEANRKLAEMEVQYNRPAA